MLNNQSKITCDVFFSKLGIVVPYLLDFINLSDTLCSDQHKVMQLGKVRPCAHQGRALQMPEDDALALSPGASTR